MKPTAGTVTRPPITAPRPSVAPSRNLLRGKRSPGSGSGIAASPRSAGTAGASVDSRGPPRSGSIAATCSPRNSFVASRAHRKPHATAIAAPIGTIPIGLMISPTRVHAIPAANPMGYSDGTGECGRPPCWGSVTEPPPRGSPLVDSIPAPFRVSTTYQSAQRAGTLTDSPVPCRGVERDPVLLPATVDEGLNFGRHPNLRRPLPGPLLGPLVSGVDPD